MLKRIFRKLNLIKENKTRKIKITKCPSISQIDVNGLGPINQLFISKFYYKKCEKVKRSNCSDALMLIFQFLGDEESEKIHKTCLEFALCIFSLLSKNSRYKILSGPCFFCGEFILDTQNFRNCCCCNKIFCIGCSVVCNKCNTRNKCRECLSKCHKCKKYYCPNDLFTCFECKNLFCCKCFSLYYCSMECNYKYLRKNYKYIYKKDLKKIRNK